jgi:hypothetical protein
MPGPAGWGPAGVQRVTFGCVEIERQLCGLRGRRPLVSPEKRLETGIMRPCVSMAVSLHEPSRWRQSPPIVHGSAAQTGHRLGMHWRACALAGLHTCTLARLRMVSACLRPTMRENRTDWPRSVSWSGAHRGRSIAPCLASICSDSRAFEGDSSRQSDVLSGVLDFSSNHSIPLGRVILSDSIRFRRGGSHCPARNGFGQTESH